MNASVAELVRQLDLRAHPEGGRFSEVFRSSMRVQPGDGRGERCALTHIYFLLAAGETARWHRVDSDELWHFYEGEPLELYCIDPEAWELKTWRLGPPLDGASYAQVIRAGCWQAARTTGAYTLVGCTVAPGFEYADYKLFEAGSTEADELRRRFPDLAVFL